MENIQCLNGHSLAPSVEQLRELLRRHHAVGVLSSFTRFGSTSEFEVSEDYLRGAILTGAPYWIVGLVISCVLLVVTITRLFFWKRFEKINQGYAFTKSRYKVWLSSFFLILNMGALACTGLAMSSATFVHEAIGVVLWTVDQSLNVVDDTVSFLFNTAVYSLNSVREINRTGLSEEELADFEVAERIVTDVETAMQDVSSVVNDVVNNKDILQDINTAALIVVICLVVVIFMGIFAPLFAVMAFPAKRSIWRPLVFGTFCFLFLFLCWVVAGAGAVIGTLSSDVCITAEAVARSLYADGGIIPETNVDTSLFPDIVNELFLRCPQNWGITDDVNSILSEVREHEDQIVRILTLIPGFTSVISTDLVMCISGLIEGFTVDCSFMAGVVGTAYSLGCGPDNSLIAFCYSLFIYTVTVAAAYTVLITVCTFGISIFDWANVYEGGDREIQAPLLILSKYPIRNEADYLESGEKLVEDAWADDKVGPQNGEVDAAQETEEAQAEFGAVAPKEVEAEQQGLYPHVEVEDEACQAVVAPNYADLSMSYDDADNEQSVWQGRPHDDNA
ncbi:hypothetical protein NDN08_006422 [Rhodosorus marinus]|uniref:Uncharacterized protein n=1 Tax=Rhodosorus marinus TaxID=101924 RepID=A0AAV8UP71_9RHOD|nr:hypothetical protein NDN08_006422 [Rhodosorus marinus]